jgi:hypothetical protein
VLAAGIVYAGTTWAGAGVAAFGAANLALVALWVAAAAGVLRHYAARAAVRG